MAAIKKSIILGLELALDALLDFLLPYKYLAKTKIDQVPVPDKFYFDYVLNQKKQRIQLFRKICASGVEQPKTIKAWWPRSHYTSNFGDLLTHYVLAGIAGIDCIYDHNKKFLAVGSVIRSANNHSVVWGSGIIRAKEHIPSSCTCLSVRGPLTRERAIASGLDCPKLYGDPAMLIPIFYTPKLTPLTSSILIAPHFRHAYLLDQLSGYQYLNVNVKTIPEIESCIDTICSARVVLTSSLHVFIMCVCYQIPVTVFQLTHTSIYGDNVKFSDFCLGLGLKPVDIQYIDDFNEDTLTELIKRQEVYVANRWEPVYILKALYKLYPTQFLQNNINELSTSDSRVY